MNNFNFQTLFDQTKIICYKNCKCCNNIDFISKNIINNKCWEPNITSLFLYLLKNKNNNIVFDVGCNIGYYSLISSKYCKEVYSFDANVNNIKMLNQSAELNNISNIEALCCAITDNDTTQYKVGILHEHNVGSMQVVQVDNQAESNILSVKLDTFIKDKKINKIDLMKIDIEGCELLCLKGMDYTLNEKIIDNIIIEITPIWDVKNAKDILVYLQNKNYTLFDVGLNETGEYLQDKYNFDNIFNNPIIDIDTFILSVNIQTNILAKKNI